MSNVMAGSNEQPSRALELTNEINKKHVQAKGICDAMIHLQDVDGLIADSLWAASDLIEDAQKAFKELREIPQGGTRAASSP